MDNPPDIDGDADAFADLVTARLVLHPLSPAEAERLVAGGPDPGQAWAPGYPDEGDAAGARRFLAVCADSGDPRPFGAYEIRRRADGRAIGGLGFHTAPDDDGHVTIGYGLIQAARGGGYAAEALRALLAFARERGVVRVEGDTDLGNTASQHVMAAAGMRLVAQDERLRFYRTDWTDPMGRTDRTDRTGGATALDAAHGVGRATTPDAASGAGGAVAASGAGGPGPE